MDLNTQDAYGAAKTSFPTWFEFLLDEQLLGEHVNADKDPKPGELMMIFLQQADATEATNIKRLTALKQLALATAAHCHWNLHQLQTRSTEPTMYELLCEMLRAASLPVELSALLELSVDSLQPGQTFCMLLFLRWSVQCSVTQSFPTKPVKNIPVAVPGLTDPSFLRQGNLPSVTSNPIHSQLADDVDRVVSRLLEVAAMDNDLMLPTAKCFPLQPEGDERLLWQYARNVPAWEHTALVCYDLGVYYFHQELFDKSMSAFQRTVELLDQPHDEDTFYCVLDMASISGYMHALSCVLGSDSQVADDGDLLYQLEAASRDESKVETLPVVLLQAGPLAMSSAFLQTISQRVEKWKKPSVKHNVQAFQAAQRVLRGESSMQQIIASVNDTDKQHLHYFFQILDRGLGQASAEERKNVAVFSNACVNQLEEGLLLRLQQALRECELAENSPLVSLLQPITPEPQSTITPRLIPLQTPHYADHINPVVTSQLWKLIVTTSATEIPALVESLQGLGFSPAHIQLACKAWQMPKEVLKVVTSQGPTVANVSCYLLLAKARHCRELKEMTTCRSLLQEARGVGGERIRSIIDWELLVTATRDQSTQNPATISGLISTAKLCLGHCLPAKGIVGDIPPTEVVESALALLLNHKETEFINKLLPSAYGLVKVVQQISSVSRELPNLGSARIAAKNLMETVTLVFSRSAQVWNRQQAVSTRDIQLGVISKGELASFLSLIKESSVLNVIISLLAKLTSLTADGMYNEISNELSALWPTSVPSAQSHIDTDQLLLQLSSVLDSALQLHPNNPHWLKTRADLLIARGEHQLALGTLLQAGAASSDFFSQNVPSHVFNDAAYRKMMKCLSHFKCHTEVALLCQCLSEPDMSLAFKVVQEKNQSDASDALYPLIWHSSLLELLTHLHNKSGEYEKEEIAVQCLAQLELNVHNPPDILQEAAKVRKLKLFRLLAKRYIN